MKGRVPYWYLLFGPLLSSDLGTVLNKVTIALNGGQMPVLVGGGCPGDWDIDWTHKCWDAGSHLKLFADWINLHNQIWSIGDTLLWVGETTFWPLLVAWIALMIRDRN